MLFVFVLLMFVVSVGSERLRGTINGVGVFTPLEEDRTLRTCGNSIPIESYKIDAGTLTVKFQSPIIVVAYTVFAFPNLALTELSWKIEGSNDGNTWTTIDEQSGVKYEQFSTSDTTYDIKSPGSYLYYRAQTPVSNMSTYIVKIELCE